MSSCLPCTDPIAPCQGCKKTQVCIQLARTCTQCPRNVCVDSNGKSSGGSGVSTGTTAGATVGGVVGVAALIGLVWWFWWRPKGLQASRKRYSQHLMNRQSKMLDAANKRKTGNGLPSTAARDQDGEGAATTKRSSVHLRMENSNNAGVVNRRSVPAVATGTLVDDGQDETVPVSRTSEDDNPFGDQNRSSIGTFGINDDAASTHTSEFSFRSSHSTNIIPIAYIPPHSSSLSVDDAQGRSHHQPQQRVLSPVPASTLPPHRSSTNYRDSIPTSMASRDSLALAGAEIIELNPLPPVLTPDTPSIPHGTMMANGAPIRPPRSPGLDLQLPKTSSPLTSPPINSPHRFSRPLSGYPFSSNTDTSNSSLSSPTSPTYPSTFQSAQLLPPPIPSSTASKKDPSRSGSSQSHLSVMSSLTTRSNNSTMSYILDPPQIITPVNSQGVKRVEFQQAKAHKLGGGGAGGSFSTPNSNSQGQPSSPTSPLALHDPFSDQASIDHDRLLPQGALSGGGRETGNSPRPVSDSSRWTATTSSSLRSSRSSVSSSMTGTGEEDDSGESVQFLQGQTITFTNPNTPVGNGPFSATTSHVNSTGQRVGGNGPGAVTNPRGISMLSVDLPRSARSSQSYSIRAEEQDASKDAEGLHGESDRLAGLTSLEERPSSWSSTSQAITQGPSSQNISSFEMSRNSTTGSSTASSHDSGILAGIPFMAAPTLGNAQIPTSDSEGGTADAITSPPTSEIPQGPPSRISLATSTDSFLDQQEDDPLPAPFLPFAGQKPPAGSSSTYSSATHENGGGGGGTGGERVQSEHFSVRSGFGSGLSQIPFQLGFPSGFGDDGEELEEGSGDGRSERGSMLSSVSRDERWSGRGISLRDDRDREEDGVNEDGEDSGLSNIEEKTEIGTVSDNSAAHSRRESVKSEEAPNATLPTPPDAPRTRSVEEEESSNPFGSHAEVEAGADPRASMDTLALSAALSANLDAQS